MILALDIGNTGIKLAFAGGDELLEVKRTSLSGLDGETFQGAFPRGELARVKRVLVCSVNPPALQVLRGWLTRYVRAPVEVVGEDFPYGIEVELDEPGRVGADRLMAALGAYHIVGGACFVVDFGSAVTVDVVSEQGHFLGGAIAAGLGLSAKALAQWTAFLPLLKPAEPSSALGRDTSQAMRSGLYYGHAGMVDRLVEELADEVGWPRKVLATGGDAELIAPVCRHVDEVHSNLTLRGLLVASRKAGD